MLKLHLVVHVEVCMVTSGESLLSVEDSGGGGGGGGVEGCRRDFLLSCCKR